MRAQAPTQPQQAWKPQAMPVAAPQPINPPQATPAWKPQAQPHPPAQPTPAWTQQVQQQPPQQPQPVQPTAAWKPQAQPQPPQQPQPAWQPSAQQGDYGQPNPNVFRPSGASNLAPVNTHQVHSHSTQETIQVLPFVFLCEDCLLGPKSMILWYSFQNPQ